MYYVEVQVAQSMEFLSCISLRSHFSVTFPTPPPEPPWPDAILVSTINGDTTTAQATGHTHQYIHYFTADLNAVPV